MNPYRPHDYFSSRPRSNTTKGRGNPLPVVPSPIALKRASNSIRNRAISMPMKYASVQGKILENDFLSPFSRVPRVDYGTFTPLVGTKFFSCPSSKLGYVVANLMDYFLDNANHIRLDHKISDYNWACSDNYMNNMSHFTVTVVLDTLNDRVITKFYRVGGCSHTFSSAVQRFCDYRDIAVNLFKVNPLDRTETPIKRIDKTQFILQPVKKMVKKVVHSSPKDSVQLQCTVKDFNSYCEMFTNWMKSDPMEALQSLLKAMPKLWLDFIFYYNVCCNTDYQPTPISPPDAELGAVAVAGAAFASAVGASAGCGSGSAGTVAMPRVHFAECSEWQLLEMRDAIGKLYGELCIVVAQCLCALQANESTFIAGSSGRTSRTNSNASLGNWRPRSELGGSGGNSTADLAQLANSFPPPPAGDGRVADSVHPLADTDHALAETGFFSSHAAATSAVDNDTISVFRAMTFEESRTPFTLAGYPPHSRDAPSSSAMKGGAMQTGAKPGPEIVLIRKHAANASGIGAAQDGVDFVNPEDLHPADVEDAYSYPYSTSPPRPAPPGHPAPASPAPTPPALTATPALALSPAPVSFSPDMGFQPGSSYDSMTSSASAATSIDSVISHYPIADISCALYLALSCLTSFLEGGRQYKVPALLSPPHAGNTAAGSADDNTLPAPGSVPPMPRLTRRGASGLDTSSIRSGSGRYRADYSSRERASDQYHQQHVTRSPRLQTVVAEPADSLRFSQDTNTPVAFAFPLAGDDPDIVAAEMEEEEERERELEAQAEMRTRELEDAARRSLEMAMTEGTSAVSAAAAHENLQAAEKAQEARLRREQDPMFTPRQSEVIEELVVNLLLENAELKHAVLVLPDLLEALVHAPASSSSSSSASSAAPAGAPFLSEGDLYGGVLESGTSPMSAVRGANRVHAPKEYGSSRDNFSVQDYVSSVNVDAKPQLSHAPSLHPVPSSSLSSASAADSKGGSASIVGGMMSSSSAGATAKDPSQALSPHSLTALNTALAQQSSSSTLGGAGGEHSHSCAGCYVCFHTRENIVHSKRIAHNLGLTR